MLKQNGTILAQYPFRLRGGGTAAGSRAVWGRSDRINMYASQGIDDTRAAVPNGHLAPSAWILPQVAGGMSSRNESVTAIVATGNAAQGLNLVSNALLTLTTSGSAAAVAAAVGSATLTISVSGTAVAPLNATGSATATLSASATTSGIASITGSATAAVSTALTTRAIGHMVSLPISQDLTVDAIASGVWSASAASNNSTGTMGEKLNDAGSAANPWTEVIESGFTAAEVLRILMAVAAGDATGMDGSAVFKSIDGTKDRVTATISGDDRTVTDRDAS